jgi:hypothetical protein
MGVLLFRVAVPECDPMIVPPVSRLLATTSAIAVTLLMFRGDAWASTCFTPEEAAAARVRAVQLEFNVVALNCRTVDPSADDPTFSIRYNDFVRRFDSVLEDNAKRLKAHFNRVGGNLDAWMTRLANETDQTVHRDSGFCQSAWDNLERSLTIEPAQLEPFAAELKETVPGVTVCTPAVSRGGAHRKVKPTAK